MHPRIEGTNFCQETESDPTSSDPLPPGNSTNPYPTNTTTYSTTRTTTYTSTNSTTNTTRKNTHSNNCHSRNPKTGNPQNWEKGIPVCGTPQTKRQNKIRIQTARGPEKVQGSKRCNRICQRNHWI